ncbi:hypothetical protein [Mycolicibacterium phocaicum]|uniref:hypothetical protein n=1 Tax=Mycolicibacterium phocaicum TaxID=319706 RepID=UPI0013D83921|nr:hypothetical protein [Mycolicibacterium phocaicum]
MLMTVPDGDLAALLMSPAHLTQTWPGSEREVMMLLHILRMAEPSVRDALAVGLVAMIPVGTDTNSSLIGLTHRSAALTAMALNRKTKEPVTAPHTRPEEVTMLELHDVAVDGRSAIRKIG